MAEENEDDFVVLTRNSETRSEEDDQFERFSNLSVTGPLIDDLQPMQNPIADVVRRVSQEGDEAWISRWIITDELSEGRQHSTPALPTSRLFNNSVIPTCSATTRSWLAADDGILKREATRGGLKSEKSDLGLRKSSCGLNQWLSASSFVYGTCAGDRREQKLFPFSLSTGDVLEGSDFNPLSHVFSARFNRKFGLPSTTKRGASRRRSFKKAGLEKAGLGRSQEQDSAQPESFFAKVVANIDSKPIDFWLQCDEAKKPESESSPLSHWLSPSSSAAVETSRCRLTEDPRANDITSSDLSKADSFSSFARRVLSSPSNEWLLVKPSIGLQPFKFTSGTLALTSSEPTSDLAGGWCSFKFSKVS